MTRWICSILLAAGLWPGSWLSAQTTTPATPETAPAGESRTNQTYRIGIGDVLALRVYREDDLNATVSVTPDGVIQVQLLGAVKVAGLTLAEANRTVTDLYAKDYLVNPHVVLDLVSTNKLPESVLTNQVNKYIVLGQVNRPGTYELKEGEVVNLLQAIALAGGYTRLGSPSKIELTRIENNEPKRIKLDAEAMLRRKEKPFEIKPDDIITVGEKIF